MKTSKKIGLVLTSLVLASAVLITSCKKKETTTPDTDTSAAADNNMAEWASNDAVTMGGQASESGSVSYREAYPNSVLSTCATVTMNPTTKIITVSFAGGVCNDGHMRSGTLTYDFSGSTGGAVYYRNPGFKCILTSSNYVVDGNAVAITHTVTNTTPATFTTTNTAMTWSVSANVTINKANSGGTVTWHCDRTHTLMNTYALTYNSTQYAAAYVDQNTVIDWPHAIVSFSGTANGTTAKGEAYSFTTTSPLVVNMNCTPDPNKPSHHPFVQGSFDFTPGSKGTRHVDFGNGTCDLICTVTITANGTTYGPYTVTLP